MAMGNLYDVVGWKEIPLATCYAISTNGEVMRIKPGRGIVPGKRQGLVGNIMKHSIASTGYPCVNLACDNGKYKVFNIHALLGEAFLKKQPHHKHVAHLDGVKTNFKLSNLAWKTAKENAADCVIHGTRYKGDASSATKIPDSMLPEIRAWKGSALILAKKLGVARSTITRIRAGTERAG